MGRGWHRECLFNGYRILVAGWKSSRDVLNNMVHWVNRTDWTLQRVRGKAGMNSLHLCLEPPPFSDSSETGCCSWVPGAPWRRKELPQYLGPWMKGVIHSEAPTERVWTREVAEWWIMSNQNPTRPTKWWDLLLNEGVVDPVKGILKHSFAH